MAVASSSSASPLSSRNLPHFPSKSPPPPPFSFPLRRFSAGPTAGVSAASPFTDHNSVERHRRDSWLNDNDVASQLPELRELLKSLKGGRIEGRRIGNVALVGTGPGDPDLLTLKAVKAIQNADLILYDRLVSNDVLELVGPEARFLYVGKTAGFHSRTQEEIHELLLSFAEAGANVVRLKGGDPLVFGRGGEEMEYLQQNGIKVKIIPGITSASGIAAEVGIPLTHRGISNSVRFLTGHSRKGGTDPLYVAENAADPESTLVVYMGLGTLQALALKLIDNGLPSSTPAVAVERGTTPQQRIVFAELGELDNEVKLAHLVSPTLIIIGKVVALSPLWPQSSDENAMSKYQQENIASPLYL